MISYQMCFFPIMKWSIKISILIFFYLNTINESNQILSVIPQKNITDTTSRRLMWW